MRQPAEGLRPGPGTGEGHSTRPALHAPPDGADGGAREIRGTAQRLCGQEDGRATFHLNWTCPELEDVIADAFYYRSMAYIHANDLPSAEADLKVMVEKRETLQYSAGEGIHEAAWLRLGDFYRDHVKDEQRAMRAYTHVLDRTMLAPYRLNVVDKPAFTGHSEALAAATRAACGILRKQGKEAEARRFEASLFQAQAKALADSGKRAEAIAKYQEALAVQGRRRGQGSLATGDPTA